MHPAMDHGLEHDALIYGSDESLMNTLVPWLRKGLEHDDGAVVATTSSHIDRFRDALGSDEGSVSFLSSDDLYVHPVQTIAAWQRMLSDAADSGVRYTRIVGEVRFGATEDLQTSWTRYESALNAVFERSPAWIVCPYDARALPPAVLDQAWRTHPTVWDSTRHPERPLRGARPAPPRDRRAGSRGERAPFPRAADRKRARRGQADPFVRWASKPSCPVRGWRSSSWR